MIEYILMGSLCIKSKTIDNLYDLPDSYAAGEF